MGIYNEELDQSCWLGNTVLGSLLRKISDLWFSTKKDDRCHLVFSLWPNAIDNHRNFVLKWKRPFFVDCSEHLKVVLAHRFK